MDNLSGIVLLIDADNTQLSKLEAVIREISSYGRIVVKRAYGNWKKDILKNWETKLNRLAIKAEQQFDYVSGKNASDMALVIDALSLLHRGGYDGFAIVSSDSDFTPLAIHLHESGVYVIGVGEKKTPAPFRNSCDEFLFLENLEKNSAPVREEPAEPTPSDEERELHELLKVAWSRYQDEEGYVYASQAGLFLKRVKPDFDVRTYGYQKLAKLLEAFPDRYDIKRVSEDGHAPVVSFRCKW